MRARDLGTPELTSEQDAQVTMRVQRNLNCPIFESSAYSTAIDKTRGVDSEFLQVQATDRDPQVNNV